MKRITALLLAVAFTLGSVAAAQADGIDIKVKGQWDFAFGTINNKEFRHSNIRPEGERQRDVDNFEARQRVRTQMNFISSEYLQAVLMFEIGDLDWGQPGTGRQRGAGLDTAGVNIETKRAYLDWIVPNTAVSVRMGLQGLALPATRMGNMVFGADVAGIVVNAPLCDNAALTAFWARPFDRARNTEAIEDLGPDLSDETDMFGLVLPLTFEGFSLTPYAVYANVGNSSGFWNYVFVDDTADPDDVPPFPGYLASRMPGSSSNAWWFGANFNLTMFDPLTFGLDLIYGRVSHTELGTPGNHLNNISASGWYIGATLDYALDWGTPGIFGWYASGDKERAIEEGRMGRLPVLGTDDGFLATSFGTAGYYGIGSGGNYCSVTGTGTGTWGIGIQVADVSFIQDLSHTLRFAYYRGTNDAELVRKWEGSFFRYQADALYLTDEDSVFEVNFDHVYKIYENLEVCLELGYLRLSADEKTWNAADTDLKKNDDSWKAEVNFRYSF